MATTASPPAGTGHRIYIIAGEASGDLHGANLVKVLKRIEPTMEIRAWGGDRMAAAGARVVKHYRELAFMGFAEVVKNLPTILRNLRSCREDIERFRPDAVILIDYPGFNLRIAEHVHRLGIPVHYYISPQVWAWKKGRVHQIKRMVDHMYVILPFEQEWYAQYDMKVQFIGHPLLDELSGDTADAAFFKDEDERQIVALLPGSRRQEIASMLPLMIRMTTKFPQYRFVVAAAPSVPQEVYAGIIGTAPVEVVHGRTYDLLRAARAALVTSGTATLEAALLNTPLVVCYRGGRLNVWLARKLVKVKYISLVNLIMDREVVRELIQDELNEDSLALELRRSLEDGPPREQMLEDLAELRTILGGPGASEKVAMAVWKTLPQRPIEAAGSG